ncbi:MAG: DUF5666 domain-containing protein [Rhodoferax sp.]|nr:DUF5666 domain-containing protein [Rhodoferax sp.]
MSDIPFSTQALNRRQWLLLTGATLTGCGGGADSLLASLPGTGGTGSPLLAQGTITGFGSVILNGIKFDVTQASVKLDGVNAASTHLRLGMVADVQAERGVDLTLGVASSIEVWSIAQGTVNQPGTNSLVVAGMSIQTSSNTVFDGVSDASQLVSGQIVTVWGLLQSGADGSHWGATRVSVLPTATEMVSSGLIMFSNGQPTLHGLVLTGSLADSLTQGSLMRVQGLLSSDARSLAVLSVRVLGVAALVQGSGSVEIEGFVTAVTSSSRFTLGMIEVDASNAVYTPSNPSLTVGSQVEVYGVLSAGLLNATKVEVESEHMLGQAEIKGSITDYVSQSNFVVYGQRCDASAASFSHGLASDLAAWNGQVKVTGTKAGDVLKVSTLEFELEGS